MAPSLYGTTPTPPPYSAQAVPNAYGQPAQTQVYSPSTTGFGAAAPPVLYPNNPYAQPPVTGTPTITSTLRLFQNFHVDHTFLYGDSGNELSINDSYVTATAAFPNFFWSGQPWYVSPGFGFHMWSGPFNGIDAQDLPPNAYSAFLDLGWRSDPNVQFGAELAGRIGVFTDFETFDGKRSVRPSGVALLRYNLTQTLALRAGVEYINRADIKLLPAGGLLWTPNPRTRWDIYFPQPKLATYLTTIGNNDVWWYVGGEYGGGAWTIKQELIDTTTLMDINDMRVMIGLEFGAAGFTGMTKRTGFIEVGYVFDRQIVFVSHPQDNFSLSETFMLRGGLNF